MAFYFALVLFILHSVGFVMPKRGEFSLFGEAVGDTVISNNTPF